MSFKKNILSNYCNHIYTLLINIAIVPLYLHYLGAAAFGLISMYVVLQYWLNLLNMGLIPALSREVACCRDQEYGFFNIRRLLRSLEIIFLFMNFLVMLIIIFNSYWIAHHWLKVQGITYEEVIHCIIIMGMMVCFRLFADLYRAGISGMEQQVWINKINIILTTVRYGGAYVLLRWITRTPSHFFEYQLLIAMIEPILLGTKFYKITLSTFNRFLGFTISWKLIGKIFPLAWGLFYTGIIWILLSQTDKLILSHILPLTIYGYFALVTVISGGISQCAMPINLAILPRMMHLFSQNKEEEMLQLYRNATQIVAVIVFPLVGILAIFGTHAIYIWTGNKVASEWAGPILFWYALGNGFLSISVFQFYLQYVLGKLKWHVIFNTLLVLIAIPMIIFFAYRFGAKGTAITWFFMQGFVFFIWPPIVHHKYAPGIHKPWLMEDIFPIFIATSVALFCIKKIPFHFELVGRDEGFIILCCFALTTLLISATASSTCRHFFTKLMKEKRNLPA